MRWLREYFRVSAISTSDRNLSRLIRLLEELRETKTPGGQPHREPEAVEMKKFVRSLRFGLLAIRHTLELERIVWPQSATCLDHIAEEMKVTALLYSLVLLIVLRHRDKEPGRIQGASTQPQDWLRDLIRYVEWLARLDHLDQAIHGGPDWL